jgi:hypothetical protein
MGDLSVNFLLSREKIMFKYHLIKSDPWVLQKNEVDPCGPTVFAHDNNSTVLETIIGTNSNEHCMYIRFLRIRNTAVTLA